MRCALAASASKSFEDRGLTRETRVRWCARGGMPTLHYLRQIRAGVPLSAAEVDVKGTAIHVLPFTDHEPCGEPADTAVGRG